MDIEDYLQRIDGILRQHLSEHAELQREMVKEISALKTEMSFYKDHESRLRKIESVISKIVLIGAVVGVVCSALFAHFLRNS